MYKWGDTVQCSATKIHVQEETQRKFKKESMRHGVLGRHNDEGMAIWIALQSLGRFSEQRKRLATVEQLVWARGQGQESGFPRRRTSFLEVLFNQSFPSRTSQVGLKSHNQKSRLNCSPFPHPSPVIVMGGAKGRGVTGPHQRWLVGPLHAQCASPGDVKSQWNPGFALKKLVAQWRRHMPATWYLVQGTEVNKMHVQMQGHQIPDREGQESCETELMDTWAWALSAFWVGGKASVRSSVDNHLLGYGSQSWLPIRII